MAIYFFRQLTSSLIQSCDLELYLKLFRRLLGYLNMLNLTKLTLFAKFQITMQIKNLCVDTRQGPGFISSSARDILKSSIKLSCSFFSESKAAKTLQMCLD